MPHFAYHINKKESEIHQILVLDRSDGLRLDIPYVLTIPKLKELLENGKLYLNHKEIVCDFYGKNLLYYQVEEEVQGIKITPRIKTSLHDFPLKDCSFICPGIPPWFIKDISLKLFTDIPWRKINRALEANLSYDEIKDESEKIVYTGNTLERLKQMQTPLPLLILKDRSGSFADLWMCYPSGKKIAFHDLHAKDLTTEISWEKDLLETGYTKKLVGTSHYYCPADRIPKTLGFLLELGWHIQDWKENRLVMLTHSDCRLEFQSTAIHVKGKLTFDTYEVDVAKIAGAFNRNERFLQIAQQVVALLPSPSEHAELCQLFEEGEVLGDSLQLPRSSVGILKDLTSFPIDESLKFLQQKPELALPGNSFHGTLRPYQQEGVNWLAFLYHTGFHGILADDMGLGKTVQVLAFLSRLTLTHPVLIVLPTSLLFNWRREIEQFLPQMKWMIHHGSQRTTQVEDFRRHQLILTSYAVLRLDLNLISSISWQCVILDEAQVIKNAQTVTAQGVCRLKTDFRLSLTGTPIENHLGELWSHFHFLIPGLLGEEQEFTQNLAAGASDSRYLRHIKKKIRPFILRRKKEEVATDLPKKVEQTVWVEMSPTQRQVYDEFLSGVRSNLLKKVYVEGANKHRLEILETILRLRQICCHPSLVSNLCENFQKQESGKLSTLLQDIETVIEEGQKALVYSQFTSMLQWIAKEVEKKGYRYAYLDGSTTNREHIVTQFQEDASIPLFLISLKAGGIGLNLTAADYVFLYDPWWNEAAENQAIDRVHRIGKQSTVFAKRYITVNSIEEKIMTLKDHKRKVIGEIFDNEWETSPITLEDLTFLLED